MPNQSNYNLLIDWETIMLMPSQSKVLQNTTCSINGLPSTRTAFASIAEHALRAVIYTMV